MSRPRKFLSKGAESRLTQQSPVKNLPPKRSLHDAQSFSTTSLNSSLNCSQSISNLANTYKPNTISIVSPENKLFAPSSLHLRNRLKEASIGKRQKTLNQSLSIDNLQHSLFDTIISENKSPAMKNTRRRSVSKGRSSTTNNSALGIIDQAKHEAVVAENLKQIEKSLTEKLAQLTPADKSKQFMIFQECFAYLINVDPTYAKLLEHIKQGYEVYISEQDRIIADLRREARTLNSSLNREISMVRKLEGNMERFSKGQFQQSNSQSEYSDVQLERREEMSELLEENMLLRQEADRNKAEIKKLQAKEKLLVKLVRVLKKKGIPVDEIYDQEVRNSHKQIPVDSRNASMETTAKSLEKINLKPPNIPRLDFTKLKTAEEISSTLSSISEEYAEPPNNLTVNSPIKEMPECKVSSKQLRSIKSVPKLHMTSLSNLHQSNPDFHSEFLSKINEFSESWRVQLVKEEQRTKPK